MTTDMRHDGKSSTRSRTSWPSGEVPLNLPDAGDAKANRERGRWVVHGVKERGLPRGAAKQKTQISVQNGNKNSEPRLAVFFLLYFFFFCWPYKPGQDLERE